MFECECTNACSHFRWRNKNLGSKNEDSLGTHAKKEM